MVLFPPHIGQYEGEPVQKGPNISVWDFVQVDSGVEKAKATFTEENPIYQDIPLTGTVRVLSGTDDFVSVTNKSRRVSVKPAHRLMGTITMETINELPETHVAPLVGVKSWEAHRWGYWLVNKWIPHGKNTLETKIDLVAPSQLGIYRLMFAFGAQLEGFYVASSTNWTIGQPVWDDGNDIADLSEAQLGEARLRGFTTNKLLTERGFKEMTLPLDFIEIVVE